MWSWSVTTVQDSNCRRHIYFGTVLCSLSYVIDSASQWFPELCSGSAVLQNCKQFTWRPPASLKWRNAGYLPNGRNYCLRLQTRKEVILFSTTKVPFYRIPRLYFIEDELLSDRRETLRPHFKRLRKTAGSDDYFLHVYLYVCLSAWNNCASIKPVSLNLIFVYFSKICRDNSSFVKIWEV